MKKEIIKFLTTLLETNNVPTCLIKDKIKYRRLHIMKLLLQGYKQKEIAHRIGCSLSTIEKDVRYVRTEVPAQNFHFCT